MKLRIRYGVGRWLMGRFRGKVFYPFVLFSQPQDDVTKWLFRHELEHVYQIRRVGIVRFYVTYLWDSIRHPYDLIPFEVEATARQFDPLTDDERQLFQESRRYG